MKNKHDNRTAQPEKKAYKKPRLVKHGSVSRLTLKAGSLSDLTTMVNDRSA